MDRIMIFTLVFAVCIGGFLYWGTHNKEVALKQDEIVNQMTTPIDSADYAREVSHDKDNEIAKEMDSLNK